MTMSPTHPTVWSLAFLMLQVTGLVITRDPEQSALISIPATVTSPEFFTLATSSTTPLPTITATHTDSGLVSVVTPAPDSSGPALHRRQPCCFNDQGFRVDCAQWTGYYYTWGPEGNPYEGGPQCDGNWNGDGSNGQGGGNGQVAPFDSLAVDWHQSKSYLALGFALLLLALVL